MTPALEDLWCKLEKDRNRGSSELLVYALENIEEILAGSNDLTEKDFLKITDKLTTIRPEMCLIVNAGRFLANHTVGKGSPAMLESVRELLNRLQRSEKLIAESFSSLDHSIGTILVFSRSGTVNSLLKNLGDVRRLVVLESHPGGEGVTVANELTEDFEVEFAYDLEMASYADEVDTVLVGADSFDENGTIHNKTGSRSLAMLPGSFKFVSVFQSLKYRPTSAETKQQSVSTIDSPDDLRYELRRDHNLFERVESEFIDYYVTEEGNYSDPDALVEDVRNLFTDEGAMTFP